MSQSLKLFVTGLDTQPNQFSRVSTGGLLVADNAVIRRPSIAETRRGFSKYGTLLTGAGALSIDSLYSYKDTLLVNYSGSLARDSDGAGTWVNYTGTYNPNTNLRIRDMNAIDSLFLSTNTGVKKLDSVSSTPYLAGAPKGLNGLATLPTNLTFTGANVNTVADTITITSHGYITGLVVRFTTTGGLPAPLALATDYYLIKIDDNTIKVATSAANAYAGTPINITTSGSGTQTINVQNQGFLANNRYVAYRITWSRKDTNNYTIEGAPSPRIVIGNTSGATRPVFLKYLIPSDADTNYYYRIYRSASSTSTSPTDDLQLVVESQLTAPEVSLGYILYNDYIDPAQLGLTLYTSTSQEGILLANEPLPICNDMALFNNVSFYANTSKRQFLSLKLNVPGEPSGIRIGDLITIDGLNYTANSAEVIGSRQFLVSTASDSVTNTKTTLRSLIWVINNQLASTVYAYAIDEDAGTFYLEAKNLSVAQFAVTGTRATSFTPNLPPSGTTLSSFNNARINNILVSKSNIPEAVPSIYTLEVGSASNRIQRVVALQNTVYVFKTDGIFRVSGTSYDNYSIESYDSTLRLIGDYSIGVMDNVIYFLSNKGVYALGENGGAPISDKIKDDILINTPHDINDYDYNKNFFAVTYQDDNLYLLFYPEAEDSKKSTYAYVYCGTTDAWTRYILRRTCGITHKNKIYLGRSDTANNYVYQENKTNRSLDYSDDSVNVTLTTYSDYTVNMVSTAMVEEGMLLTQGLLQSYITEVAVGYVIVEDLLAWQAGAAIAYSPIAYNVQFVLNDADNPGIVKQFREITVLSSYLTVGDMTFTFTNSFDLNGQIVEIETLLNGAWGVEPWGNFPWGGNPTNPPPIRTYIPLEMQYCNWIKLRIQSEQVFANMSLEGVSFIYRPILSVHR